MPVDVIMPNLGLTMEEGVVARWLVAPGQQVERGQPLFEVETDKVSVEVEALAAGVLGPVLVEAGRKVAVGTVLARIVGGNEGRKTDDERTGAVLRPPASDPSLLSGQALRPPLPGSRAFSSPRARTVAKERGIDWRALSGSGPRGRVIERDVLAPIGPAIVASHPIAAYLTAEVDLSRLLDAHRRLTPFVADLQLVDWLVYIAGVVLDEMGIDAAMLAASLRGQPYTISRPGRSLMQLVAQRSRSGATPTPPAGPVFHIHDLSASRIDVFLPPPVAPEVACLVLGRIDKAGHANLSLSFDHSAMTGEQAARLVETLIDLIEGPEGLLLAV